jgi:hypothetical protein
MNTTKWLMPLGMLGTIFYFAHTILGSVLWQEYNPITTDISSLTADGAPHAGMLRVLTMAYGVCFVLFVLGMLQKAFKDYHKVTKTGYVVLLVMALSSVMGYSLFPLTGDKEVMNFQNLMHIVVTALVVVTTIASLFLIAIGYLKFERLKPLGRIALTAAILITCFGMLNPISMSQEWNVLGLTERLVIYTLQLFVFLLSYVYTRGTGLSRPSR